MVGGGWGRGGEAQADVVRVAAQVQGEGVVGAAEDVPQPREVLRWAGGRAGGAVGALGVGVRGVGFGAGVVVVGQGKLRGAGLAAQGVTGVEQPLFQIQGKVEAQTCQELARVGGAGLRPAGGAVVGAELGGVAREARLDPLLGFRDGVQGPQADEVLRQGVHGVRRVRPEQVGQAAAGLRAFEQQVGKEKQGFLAPVGGAVHPQATEREKFHRPL
ncbi:hypothetical protein AUC44_05475 [Deinococcus actinosclerus]|uniref:Uncharacterized protein n=1 Tax=Deinococcus actinosclerus TaxID=1768108 RepID=A0ABM5X3T3_9DEIO|nr:hypothetical protein AUC44_05475 [Deinococcus actinosclerus]